MTAWYEELAPPPYLSVPAAHFVMRLHLDCCSRGCDWRRTALATLVATGRYVPARGGSERR